MFSSNDKLIEAVLKRLIKKKKNNFYNDILNDQKTTNNIKVRRLSTLLSRGSADKKRFSVTKSGNKMNLKIVPLIKRRNILLKMKNFNEMIYNTESVEFNNYVKSDKIFIRKPKINNLNINAIKTFSNFVCTSDSFRKGKSNKKKHLFLSPYQVGLNKTKLFRNMVNLSKDIHSPKKRGENLIYKNFNIRSFSGKPGKNKDKDYFGIPKTFSEKKYNIKRNIFNYSQKVKSESKKKGKYKYKGFKHRNEVIKNIIKDENKRKANCYYNKLHLIKMNDIIDKYSYNNKDL